MATLQIESMKSDKSDKFEEIYQESFAFSTEHGFDIPTETARKRRGDIQENDQTCKSRVQGLYDELLSIFIDEIRSRFSNEGCIHPSGCNDRKISTFFVTGNLKIQGSKQFISQN